MEKIYKTEAISGNFRWHRKDVDLKMKYHRVQKISRNYLFQNASNDYRLDSFESKNSRELCDK